MKFFSMFFLILCQLIPPCFLRLVLEFPATGGCIPHPMFRTLKLIRYVTPMDYFVMACEAIFVLFLVYYSIEEFIEIKKHKLAYFKAFWNVLDVVVILLGVVCIVFNLYRTMSVNRLIKSLLTNPDGYANFAVLGFWQNQYDNLVAVAVFICWIKVCVIFSKFFYVFFMSTSKQRLTYKYLLANAGPLLDPPPPTNACF